MTNLLRKIQFSLRLKKQDADLLRMAKTLAQACDGNVYLVGGFVRDTLLGVRSKDIDVEVSGVEEEVLEKRLVELFGDCVNAVGASFQTWKVHLDGTRDMDVSLPRRESKTDKGHKGFQVTGDPGMKPPEAARRRDFTINAIMYDLARGEIVDPFNGVGDLKAKILRVVDPKTFIEDPLRLYRAVQFAARFDLTVDPVTKALLTDMVASGELESLSKERVTDEIKKLLLKASKPSIGFELMREIGIIEKYFPELHALRDTEQEPEWHPEGDVWIHTMMVIDEAANIIRQEERGFDEGEKLSVMLGALCHDLGKPATTKMGEKEGIPRIRSLGHSEAGIEPARTFFSKFLFGESVCDAAMACVLSHLKPGHLFFALEKDELTPVSYDNAVRKLLKKHRDASWEVLIACAEADFRGRTLPESKGPYRIGQHFTESIKRQGLEQDPVQPLLLGRDLLELGVPPGPSVGELIQKVEEERDRGALKTKEEALAFAKTLIGK